MIFEDKTEAEMVTKWFFKVSVRKLYKRIFSDKNDGGIKEAKNKENNIIISDSKIRTLLPP